jgi:RNA polymerase sigma-70 factor (ECF subfamily)
VLNGGVNEAQVHTYAAHAAAFVKSAIVLDRAMQVAAERRPASQATAEDLVSAIAARRDRRAFAELFDTLGPRVNGYLMRQGTDRETAEDLVQDVMLTVWNRAHQYDRNKAAVSTWVFTIARNRRIDRLRRERRPELDPDDPALVPEPEKPADSLVDTAQTNKLLHAMVAQLPKEQKELLRLAYFEDKSHSAIAEQLSLPLGTVKSRLRLAIAKLRAVLETEE